MFDVTITIFSLNGLIIRILKFNIPSTGYRLSTLEWDGHTSTGQRAGRGIYPYRVTITSGNGETATISGRMIIY
jgi:flagellar hook assembly protein FlgD